MITKSISPDKIKNVEVRFDEKNNKLKESLLEGEKFVVLDISLKSDVKKSIFGKQEISTGYQKKPEIGGMTNLFSLNPKINMQVFAENNNFEETAIDLFAIKNIGEESLAQILSTPIDIDDIKSRSAYHKLTYGFKKYTTDDNSIAGLSVNIPITQKTDLYVGSFNNYHFIRNHFRQQSWYNENLIYNFDENNNLTEYNSKSKVQLKHTSNNFKLKSDINYVYLDQSVINSVVNNYNNNFRKRHFSSNWYFNNHLEYLLNKKLGIFAAASYSQENYKINTNLNTDNTYAHAILGTSDDFYQRNINEQTLGSIKSDLTYKGDKWGTHTIGYRYHRDQLWNEKISNSTSFSTAEQKYINSRNTMYYNSSIYWKNISLITDLGYTSVKFPYRENGIYGKKNKNYLEYILRGEYNFSNSTRISLQASSQLGLYPISKTTFGNMLMDFQTIFVTNQEIAPFYNKSYSTSFITKIKKTELYLSYTKSISNNSNNQLFNNDFIFINSSQLSGNYHIFSNHIKGRFKKWNLSYILEPEALFNTSEYVVNNNLEKTRSNRYFLGAHLKYTPKNKRVEINYHPKYTNFSFSSTTSNIRQKFDFLSNEIETKLYFFEQKLMTSLTYRQVNFLQNSNSFNNLSLHIGYKTKKNRWFLNIGNMLNSKYFTTQDYNYSLMNISQNAVFRRYINLGFEMKIN